MKFFTYKTAWDSILDRTDRGETSDEVCDMINIILDNDKIDEFNLAMEEEFPNGCDESEIDFLIEEDKDWLLDKLNISHSEEND